MKEELMEWHWHKQNHTQIICTSLQRDNHANTTSFKFFTGRMLFLMLNKYFVKALRAEHLTANEN